MFGKGSSMWVLSLIIKILVTLVVLYLCYAMICTVDGVKRMEREYVCPKCGKGSVECKCNVHLYN